MENRIFILKTKKSNTHTGVTYCIAIFRLGTEYTEFACGTTNDNRTYKTGDEISYVYNADYYPDLLSAMTWLKRQE